MGNLRLNFGKLPVHILLIGLCVVWLVPTIGLLVTSICPVQDVNRRVWQALEPPLGQPSSLRTARGVSWR